MSLIWLLVLLMRKNHIFIKDYSSHTLICDSSDAKNDILPSTEIALLCDFPFVRKQPLKIALSSNERFLAPTFFFLLRREFFFLFPSVVVSKELFSSSFGSGLASIRARKRVSPSSRANSRRRYPKFAGIEQLNIFFEKKKKIMTFY